MERFQNTRQPDWDWWGKLWPTPGETLRELGLSAGTSVVEIGSGNGYFALPAARIVDPAPVYAVDVDRSLLDELESITDAQEIENVVPIRADARLLADHLPERVDVGVVANTFHGVEDPAMFVEQVASVLGERGRLIVVNWHALPRAETTVGGQPKGPPTDRRLAPTETRDIAESVPGVTFAETIELPPYHYALVFDVEE